MAKKHHIFISVLNKKKTHWNNALWNEVLKENCFRFNKKRISVSMKLCSRHPLTSSLVKFNVF